MKIDFGYKFVNLDGTTIPEQPDEPEIVDGIPVMKDGKPVMKKFPPFTLRKACVNALVMRRADAQGKEKQLSGEEKFKRYQLAVRIHNAKELLDLSSEEISLLKKLVGETYPPLTTGQAWENLDPHSAGEKK